MNYRPEIDGLRALAVIPVILFHAGFDLFAGGFVGVDVFFVISGYLITSIILAEQQAGTFTLLNFYERRARRILPALFTVMFATFPFAWLWLLPADLKYFSQSAFAVAAFSSNFLFFIKSGYFDSAAELIPLLHTWSLAVEEQYYLLFPLFLLVTLKWGRRRVVTLLAVAAVASFALAIWSSRTAPGFGFYLLPARAWELLLGVFAAFYLSGTRHDAGAPRGSSGRGAEIASLAGFALILFAIFSFDRGTPFPGYHAAAPTLGTLAIILFATPHTLIGRLLGQKALVGIGLISYSAYLWHQPLFVFWRQRSLQEPDAAVALTLIFATGVLAYFTWRYIEKPFRDRRRFPLSHIAAYGALCSLFLLVSGFTGHSSGGFPDRTAPSHLPLDYFEAAVLLPVALEGIDGNRCISESASMGRVNAQPGALKILLVGDSHSADYSAEFQRFVKEEKLDAWQFSIGGCAFLPSQSGVNNGECGRARRLLEEAIAQQRFDRIIFVGDYYSHTEQSDGKGLQTDMDSLSGLIGRMLELDARVIFFRPRYALSAEPMRAAMLGEIDRVRVVRGRSQQYVDRRIDRMAVEGKLVIFNERDALIQLGCGSADCFDGHTPELRPLYRDQNHLTNYGARLIFQQLTSSLD